MTARRLALTAIVAAFVFVLAYGARALTSGGVPVPSAASASSFAPVTGTAIASASMTAAVPPPSPPVARSAALPRPDLTPGAIDPDARQDNLDQTVCRSGWAASIRPPSAYTGALKLAQILEYGYRDRNPRHYQEDHLVPLELGGAPRDRRNLWPEPNAVTLDDGTTVGSKQKDALEDRLHAEVCDGSMTLADAQRAIATDWIAAWVAAGRP